MATCSGRSAFPRFCHTRRRAWRRRGSCTCWGGGVNGSGHTGKEKGHTYTSQWRRRGSWKKWTASKRTPINSPQPGNARPRTSSTFEKCNFLPSCSAKGLSASCVSSAADSRPRETAAAAQQCRQPTSRQDATEERERSCCCWHKEVGNGIVLRLEEEKDGRAPTPSTGLLYRGTVAIVLQPRAGRRSSASPLISLRGPVAEKQRC